MLVQWTTETCEMCLFHISKTIYSTELHFNIQLIDALTFTIPV